MISATIIHGISRKCTMQTIGHEANRELKYVVELVELGKLKPFISKWFPLEKTADAFGYFETG